MSVMKCKYCGLTLKQGQHCYHSPNGLHVAVQNGHDCVYCGLRYKIGEYCYHSPSKRHQLDS
jgi:hypothetical protein